MGCEERSTTHALLRGQTVSNNVREADRARPKKVGCKMRVHGAVVPGCGHLYKLAGTGACSLEGVYAATDSGGKAF